MFICYLKGCVCMKEKVNKPGSNNPMQKGERRQQIHKNQNNVGDFKKPSYFKNFNGDSIEQILIKISYLKNRNTKNKLRLAMV